MHLLPSDELRMFAGRGRAPAIPVPGPTVTPSMIREAMSQYSVSTTIPNHGTITMQHSLMFSDARIVTNRDDTTPQKDRLSVLYVDDEPEFLDLCKIYLERGGEISLTCITSAHEALDILESSFFDVIVSDYQMPDLDGIGFLKHLQKINCTIPFILFTGRGREEVVIQAINNGATFYLQKGGDPKSQFAELTHKIKEAARRRQVEKALKESENRYRTIFENTGTAIVIIAEDTTVSLANTEFLRLTGYRQEEVINKKSWKEFVVKEDLERLLAQHREQRGGNEATLRQYETRIMTKNGEIRHMLVTIDRIPGTEQSIASLIDITNLKRAEEELKKKTKEIDEAYERLAEAEEILHPKVMEKTPTCPNTYRHPPTASDGI